MDPKPVDVSALERLGILGKAKQVMNVVESREPEKKASKSKDFDPRDSYNQSIFDNSPIYSESDEKEPVYENYQQTNGVIQNNNYTAEQVMASNLPPIVKEAMLKNPIPRLSGPPSKVSAEAIAKLTGATIRKPNGGNQKQMLRESDYSNNSDMITISRTELQNIVDESINRFFKHVYNKTVTEETIKKTINTLIKEGKIQTKRKN
jgi:hypothetical protein